VKIIFSYVNFKLKNKNIEQIIKMAAVSNFLAQQLGYETILFVDQKSEHLFKKINYTNLSILDDKIISNLPQKIWSLGKLLAINQMKEPFFHIDFDVLLFKRLDKFLEKKPFTCFHAEEFLYFDKKNLIHICEKLNVYIPKPVSLNCAIVGVNNFKIINEIIDKLINYSLSDKHYLEQLSNELEAKSKSWLLPVIFEQILFTNLVLANLKLSYHNNLILKNLYYEQIFPESFANGILHLWDNKDKDLSINIVNSTILHYKIRY